MQGLDNCPVDTTQVSVSPEDPFTQSHLLVNLWNIKLSELRINIKLKI